MRSDPVAAVSAHPDVAEFSVGTLAGGMGVEIDGRRVGLVSFEAKEGYVWPPLLEGRPPGRGEIVLGATTMDELDLAIGDGVDVEVGPGATERFRVVGTGVLPSADDATGLGRGALFNHTDLVGFEPTAEQSPQFFIRLAPGADRERVAAELSEAICPYRGLFGQNCQVWRLNVTQPHDVVNFGRAENTPLFVAASLGALAAGTLAHILLTGVRRRRRDLAVLKTLGFTRSQVRTTIGAQATATLIFALIIAIPVGIAAGRVLWTAQARSLGVVNEPAVPWLALAALVAASLILANLIAVGPSRAAARTRPADELRTE
jgi:hypothetical protein